MSVRRTIVRMAKKIAPTKQLIESVLGSISASKVDREAGVIYGVRLGGLISKNKRRYTEAAYKEKLTSYEGLPCNINHVKEGEQVEAEDRFGIWHKPRWQDTPEPGPVADLHYIKSHPIADRVCESAERPDLAGAFGMSHVGVASKTSNGADGWIVVEAFEAINSVDLVADPATVKGLFEHTEKKPMKQTIKALIESALNFPAQKRIWEQYAKGEDAAKRITEEIETPDGAAPVALVKAGFDAIATSIATDDTLTPDEVADKIKATKATQAELVDGKPVEKVEPKKDDGKPKESVIGVTKAGRLCESLKFQPNIKQLTLISESSEAQAKELAEEFARLSLVKPEQTPTSAARWEVVQESKANQPTQPAATAEELAARIR